MKIKKTGEGFLGCSEIRTSASISDKRKIVAAVFLLAFALCLESVLADAGKTRIEGKIYEGDLSNGIGGANVTVTCYHEGSNHTEEMISWPDGDYIVFFFKNKCEYGDSITVNAEKDGMTGTNSGIVDTRYTAGCFTLDVGIVNVPLIPEFGMIVGTLTAVSAIGIFLFVRRK